MTFDTNVFAAFNENADKYFQRFQHDSQYHAWYEKFAALINPKGQLLDVGCGPGLFAGYLKSQLPALQITGIDLSPKMIELADGFIGLPGGFGTLEEMLEVMTLKQLGYHEKPIVFLNVDGYYSRLFEMFEHIYDENFAKAEYRQLYHISETPEDAMAYLSNYQPPALPDKWFV